MVWVKGELTVTKVPYSDGDGFYYNAEWANEEKPRDRKFDTYGVDKETPNGVAAYARSKWAKAQLKRAAQLREYAEWIEGRLANWAPQELTPVED